MSDNNRFQWTNIGSYGLPVLFTTTLMALPAWGEEVDFKRDIRPILSSACFECHGPDAEQRQADLRLDAKDVAFADRGGYAAIVAGKPDASELLRRIVSDDPDEKMPPSDSGKTLSAKQIATIRTWIEQGAKWSQHWSFIPPAKPAIPTPERSSWIRSPIDAFVLDRLDREGLEPSSQAEKATLLRRLSLDLIGLPPTIEQVDDFLADNDPEAYEKQVERLLRSPHFGERWGRHWLDAARYADSDGYEKDKSRRVWFYRDWVIGALNRDLPYDRFVIEQIAGDLLPNATQDEMVATGFLRNSMINEEGGIDPEQFRMEAMYDRMDAIGKSILGLTIQCAQCHSHKYDPLTQEEYYRMFAFVNNAHEANIAVYTPEEQAARTEIFNQIAAIEREIQQSCPDWQAQMNAWEETVKGNQPEWIVVHPEFIDSTLGGQKFFPQSDGSYLAQGYAPTKTRPQLVVKTDVQGITAFRLELLNDPNLPLGGPGRSLMGTGALTEFEVETAPADNPDKSSKVTIAGATADISIPQAPLQAIYGDKSKTERVTGPIEYAIDGKVETAWSIDAGPGRRNQPRKAVFVAEKPIANTGGTVLSIYLKQHHGGWNSDDNQNYNLGRFRISITTAKDPVADPLPKRVREILAVARAKRTPEQRQAVFSFWRSTVPAFAEANAKIESLWQRHPPGSAQLVLRERMRTRETHLLERGDFLKPKQVVDPGVPAFLHSLPGNAPCDRLSFARWLVDRQSPTTARSFVNRVWQAYFGTGIVASSEDLGSQSQSPSHPELLDWLAVEFMDQGWSMKSLHRLIVTSSTYRQSSRAEPDMYAKDPDNRLLARGPRLRVEAEVVRDIALAASGLLNRKIGGPSVYPPAPEFLFQPPASYGPKNWYEDAGADRYRRAMYTFRFRSVPYPMLEAFDAPNGDFSCVRRSRSNTPLQALVTLNEPLFVECARALARRTIAAGGSTDHERLEFAFRCCLSRKPSQAESRALLAMFRRQHQRFRSGELKPGELVGIGHKDAAELTADTPLAELAAWTAVSRVLLNLDETITKE